MNQKQAKFRLVSLLGLALLTAQLLGACGETTGTVNPTGTAVTAVPTSGPTGTTPALVSTTPSATTVQGTTNASTTAVPAAATTTGAASAAPSLAAVVPVIKRVEGSDQVGRYDRFELTIDLTASINNPIDPAQVDLHATFTAPSGQSRTVPGFYFQDFTSQQSGGKEVLTAKGQPAWKIRFAPTETGQYTYRVEVVTPGGKAQNNPASLKVNDSSNQGYLRVSQQDPAYLEFSTGKPYFAIGQNVGWYDTGGTYDYEKWFKGMAANGANATRVWMASWALGIEWSDGPLGDYSKRMDRAWQLDRVFQLAEQDNIYIMLSLLNHGAFSKTTNTEWAQNPYNAALGGPLADPEDFATNPQARDLFKRRLRYIVARWGYSTNLMAWEWWNEVDFTPIGNRDLLKPWIEEMNHSLQSWESFPHLRTTSYSKGFDEIIYRMPEIDLLERHEYSPQEPGTTFPNNMADLRALGKPAIYAEFGTSGGGADSELDKTGLALHNAQWAALMTKGFGTSMSWWWDSYIDPLNLYPLFNELTGYLKDENLPAQHYQPARLSTGGGASALVLNSDNRVLGWVRNSDYSYQGLKDQYQAFLNKALAAKQTPGQFVPAWNTIGDLKLTFDNLKPGNYRLEWWSAGGTGMISSSQQTITGASLTVTVLPFDKDLAFKLILAS